MTPPAMGDERRWAARYQFLEQLWRGRDRIICDREVEAALHAGVDGPLAELLAQLLPGDSNAMGDARAWVALHNDRRAVSFARSRSGTVFAGLDEAGELASEEDWQVALINLDSLDDGGPSEQLEALLEIVGERSEDREDCSVVLTLACGDDEDHSYEQLASLVEQLFGDARIYGLTRPSMAAFYDFGAVLESDGGEGGEAGDANVDEPAAAGIEVDNTLGTDAPRFDAFVAVIGTRMPAEGLTFVELPSRQDSAGPGRRDQSAGLGRRDQSASSGETEELAALRLQLAEAQRRGDMHAIERQSLLERLEQAEDRIANLDEELESRDGPGESGSDGVASDGTRDGIRMDELLAREQSLRWELDRVRGELENLRVRPVEELEAELASTQAQLEQAEAALAEAETALAEDSDGGDGAELLEAAARALAEDEPSPAQAREWMKARAKLDHLLRKLERGGEVSALELHRELSGLRRLL
jgi:hypothetical protein